MRIEGDKLEFFQNLYYDAEAKCDTQNAWLQRYKDQYDGKSKLYNKEGVVFDFKVTRNITYELIESQVSSYIPTASVEPSMYSERNIRNAKSVETLLRNKRNQLPYEKMNDTDERFSTVYGGSIWLVEWDNNIKTHNTVGDVKLTCFAPHRFIGQPNIYNIDDMDYCFIKYASTIEEIEKIYGVEISEDDEVDQTDIENPDDKTLMVYVCFYKNEQDKICKFAWSADTVLLDIDDYYARKKKICKKCGKEEGLCECEHPKFEMQSDEEEILEEDIKLSDGSVIPKMSPKINDDGTIATEEVERPIIDENGVISMRQEGDVMMPNTQKVLVPKMERTHLPFYTPNVFPIVIRKNVSQEDSLLGQSDCYAILDQQLEVNKIESEISEKLHDSGVFLMVPEGANIELTNEKYKKVLRVKQNEASLYNVFNTQTNIQQDIAQGDRVYDQAKRILGINNSYQGQYDASAQSGKAKEIQVKQAQGRLDSKKTNKNAAYADIDKIIFQYYLAYADEPRPSTYTDALGNKQNIMFNKYDFIERDDSGEYYYNDQYLFSADATGDIEQDRQTLWQENRLNYQTGAYGNPQDPQASLIFWQNMEKLHYPFAHDNVERIKNIINGQIAQMQKEVDNRVRYEEYLQNYIKNSQMPKVEGGINNAEGQG